MTITLESPSLQSDARAEGVRAVVQRVPFTFSSSEESQFAWLHLPDDSRHYRHGVVICPPIGYEHLHTHRALRYLADELALHSIPAMRFDWSGHGDSAGTDEDPDRVRTWQQNVRDAVAWMREYVDGGPVSVIGLRMGALLAATALADVEIENLVLWAPVIHGREFVREMKALDLAGDAPRDPNAGFNRIIEAAGFLLTETTVAELSALRLTETSPSLHHLLLAQRDDGPAETRLQSWAEARGIVVETISVSGYGDMLREPHRSTVPHAAIDQICGWLEERVRSTSLDHGTVLASVDVAQITEVPSDENCADSVSRPNETFREQACWIGPERDLFGVLTEPLASVENHPTIILLNAGSSYRIGPGRLNVLLARTFAREGFRCLRLDLQGLGDSPTVCEQRENDPYPSSAFKNVNDAIEFLQKRFGSHPCVMMGLCSGAYAAFQSAAQLPSPALVESILINPLTFFWRDGMTIDDDTTAWELYQSQHYFESAFQLQKWWKLLSGRSSIGLAGALRLVLRKLRPQRAVRDNHVEPPVATQCDDCFGHPRERNLAGDLARIARADRHLSFFFAAHEPGLHILQAEARQAVSRHQASGQLEIHTIEKADHTFSRHFARRALIELLCTHLNRRYARCF